MKHKLNNYDDMKKLIYELYDDIKYIKKMVSLLSKLDDNKKDE
jgi:hypothetical protein